MGRQALADLVPRSESQWLSEEQAAVRECLAWLGAGLPSAQGAFGLSAILDRAAKEGTLSAAEFLVIRRTVEVYRVLGELADPEQFPLIAAHVRTMPWPRSLAESIDATFDPDGLVRDRASPQLADLRRQIRQLEREIDDVFERILHGAEWSRYLQDGVITVRYGRRVLPVKHEFRNSVPGIVHDVSGSGQTVFVEPLAVVERQNRLTTLRQDEAREIERILTLLTHVVRQAHDALSAIHRHLRWMDWHCAVSRYGLSIGGILPDLGGERLALVDARHPLLAQPVPISLYLSADRPALIITGPNTGGKTVAIKTAGVLVLMALAGLMVPAQVGTTIPIYQAIMADIGDEQSLEQNLSTFSGHLMRLVPMLRDAASGTLCLIDEIGAGTDPEEGAALAEVIVRHLVERRAHLIASTHYSRLKLLALSDPRIENASVEFDRESLTPTYHLMMGSPGSSHAFYIARRLGFPPELVDQAESLLDPAAISLADAIASVHEMDRRLREELAALGQREEELRRRQTELEERERRGAEKLEREREKALKAWRREQEELTEKFNQALHAFKEAEGRDRARAVEALRDQYRGIAKVPTHLKKRPKPGSPPSSVGDRVRVAGFPDVGVVTALTGRTATVEIGSLRLKLVLDDLEMVADAPSRPQPRRLGTTSDLAREKSQSLGLEVDLRGMTQAEALEALDKYLDDAVLASAPFVRIIHGKGTGALRRAVLGHLKGDPRVVRYRLGEAGEGGDGVTVAMLEDTD